MERLEDLVDPRLATLLEAAVLAPSGDNMQPWLFKVDAEANTLDLHLSEWADRSPLNLGRRMDRIALGAAFTNMVRTADHLGRVLEASPPLAPALASLQVGAERASAGHVPAEVKARVTNRRLYHGTLLAHKTRRDLEALDHGLPGITLHWVFDGAARGRWAELIARADRLMFGLAEIRNALLGNVRFDAPASAEVDRGLSLGSLELSAVETLGMKSLRVLPDWLLKQSGLLRLFAKHAHDLVASSSGLCLLVGPDGSQASDFLIGQAMQQVWLELTRLELAVQPMMSLLILENIDDQGGAELVDQVGRVAIQSLRDDWRAVVPELSARRPGFLLRFGVAESPTSRTGRIPWQQVTRVESRTAACGAAE
ncbi:MAG: hypothetical protein AB7K24_20215 [Gemmataceae bacterium]